jgi:hypothetical protein
MQMSKFIDNDEVWTDQSQWRDTLIRINAAGSRSWFDEFIVCGRAKPSGRKPEVHLISE